MIVSKHKIRYSIIILLASALSLSLPVVRSFVDQALLITRYSGQGVNAFTSGRIDGYVAAFQSFWEHPLIGNGIYYIDCSYLMILAETGIIGLIIIEAIWISRLFRNFKWKTSIVGSQWKHLIILITVFFIVESILEGLPPFGPGVSSFIFWMLCSITVDNKRFEYLNQNENEHTLEL